MAAPPPPFDPEDFVKRLAEGARSVRLGQGVVGKTTRAMLLLIPLWGLIVWRVTGNPWEDALLVAIGLIATGAFVWWTRATHAFAQQNPAQAMLEGAELLEYQRIEAEAKGRISSSSAPLLDESPVRPIEGEH
jgi:hypothetical protein